VDALFIETDGLSGATYITLREEPVAATRDLNDIALVDVDEHGAPVGVEFPGGLPPAGDEAWHFVVTVFPQVREAFHQRL
jgi:hypothetical protein